MSEGAQSLMSALGFSAEAGELYGRLLAVGDGPVVEVAEALGMEPSAFEGAIGPLEETGVLSRRDGVLHVLPPLTAVTRLLASAAEDAQRNHLRMLGIARAMPYIAGSTARPPAEHVDTEGPLDGEVFTSERMREAVEAITLTTAGQVRWIRPDRFELGYEEALTAAVAAGRRVRTIYPIRALVESASTLAYRARLGEEVRLLADVPTRLLVLGTTHAIMPEPLGVGTSRRLLVRQPAMVQLCTLYFDLLWARAHPVSTLVRGEDGGRRALLEQLASGASDEQIARRLGVSVRTVRRRVAEVLSELGVESRFAAGVAAARRGWV